MNAFRTLQLGLHWFPERPSGLDRYFHDLLRHLSAAGVEARGWVAGTEAVAADSGGTVRAFAPADAPLPRRLAAARRWIAADLAQDPAALTVSHFPLYTAPVLDRLRGRPLVVHFHGPWAAEARSEGAGRIRTLAQRAIEGLVYRHAVRHLTLSRAFAAELERRYGIPGERIRVVPGGVIASRFDGLPSRADCRRGLGWPEDRPIVLVVRRLVRRMGLTGLLEAMPALRAQVPEVLLLVAGEGPLRELLARRIAEAGLDRNVRLLGRVSDADLPLAYAGADLGVVPSRALEGFGLVAAESLAAGTPVLVTDVGGLPEVVTPLDPGLVLPDPTPAGLAAGLAAALRGGHRLPDGETCRRYARAAFDWPVVAQRVGAVYREARV